MHTGERVIGVLYCVARGEQLGRAVPSRSQCEVNRILQHDVSASSLDTCAYTHHV